MELDLFVKSLFKKASEAGFSEYEVYYVDRESLSISVYKSEVENQIDLKIFLKLLPNTPQNFTEDSHILTFGSGQIVQTRGGNTRSLKAYDLTFNYELCYRLE